MAYGYFCPSCAGTVDSNEFNHGKGICRECEEKQEKLSDSRASKHIEKHGDELWEQMHLNLSQT